MPLKITCSPLYSDCPFLFIFFFKEELKHINISSRGQPNYCVSSTMWGVVWAQANCFAPQSGIAVHKNILRQKIFFMRLLYTQGDLRSEFDKLSPVQSALALPSAVSLVFIRGSVTVRMKGWAEGRGGIPNQGKAERPFCQDDDLQTGIRIVCRTKTYYVSIQLKVFNCGKNKGRAFSSLAQGAVIV